MPTMCQWRRAKPSSGQAPLPPSPVASGLILDEMRVSISSSINQRRPSETHFASEHAILGTETTRYRHHNIVDKALPPLPPSTNGSINGSLQSVHGPSHPAAGPIGGRGSIHSSTSPNGGSSFIETLPNEILELVFHFAIASSFPLDENPRWPMGPMFSRGRRSHGTKHSPSNSSGSEVSSSGVSMRSVSSDRTQTELAAPRHPGYLLPTTLSQTCRRFRFVLRCSPELWSFIHLTRSADYVAPSGQRPRQHGMSWLPTYLARSRGAKLHLTFDTSKFSSFVLPVQQQPAHVGHREQLGNGPNSETDSFDAAPHPDSILALLRPHLRRVESIVVLASHIGSPALNPLLRVLARVSEAGMLQGIKAFRVSMDIWREGIVGISGVAPPPLFLAKHGDGTGGGLTSLVLEGGVHLDWKSCAGVGIPPSNGSRLDHGGTFRALKNLELRFVGARYPKWEQLGLLLGDEVGCPMLERLVVRDEFEAVMRAVDPPDFSSMRGEITGEAGGRIGAEYEQVDTEDDRQPGSPSSPMSFLSARQVHMSHIASLGLTLPSSPARHGRRRAASESSSSGGSSASSSAASSPTSPYYQQFERQVRGAPVVKSQREAFRKIRMGRLKALEVDAFPRGSRTRWPCSADSQSVQEMFAGGAAGADVRQPHALARFLYLFDAPGLEKLRIGGLNRGEWEMTANVLGLPRTPEWFEPSVQGHFSSSLMTLDVDLVDE